MAAAGLCLLGGAMHPARADRLQRVAAPEQRATVVSIASAVDMGAKCALRPAAAWAFVALGPSAAFGLLAVCVGALALLQCGNDCLD